MSKKVVYKTPEQEVDATQYYSGAYHTFDGHKISAKEEKFIQNIIKGETKRDAYRLAFNDPTLEDVTIDSKATTLLNKRHIAGEIEHRFELAKSESIATAQEIMEYFTKVMRGEEKDQFGLDAPLGERTSAAKELMKRVVEMEEQAKLKAVPEIKVTLNFDRDGKEKD